MSPSSHPCIKLRLSNVCNHLQLQLVLAIFPCLLFQDFLERPNFHPVSIDGSLATKCMVHHTVDPTVAGNMTTQTTNFTGVRVHYGLECLTENLLLRFIEPRSEANFPMLQVDNLELPAIPKSDELNLSELLNSHISLRLVGVV